MVVNGRWQTRLVLLRCGSLAGRRLQGGEIGVLDGFHAPFTALLLDRLYLIERGCRVFGIADLAIKPGKQVVDGAGLIA